MNTAPASFELNPRYIVILLTCKEQNILSDILVLTIQVMLSKLLIHLIWSGRTRDIHALREHPVCDYALFANS